MKLPYLLAELRLKDSQKVKGERDWLRWQSKKTLSSSPLTGTPKSELFAEQP